MAPYLKVFIILCAVSCRVTADDKNSTAVDKNNTAVDKKTEKAASNKTVAKREFLFGGWYGPDVALLQAGLHLAEYPFERYAHGAFQLAQQLLHHGLLMEHHKGVHQPQELPTSPPRNPKRPIYHYTPLPQGTFPAHHIEEKDERHHDDRYYQQMYYGGNSLQQHHQIQFIPDFGGIAHYSQPSLHNLYFHSPIY